MHQPRLEQSTATREYRGFKAASKRPRPFVVGQPTDGRVEIDCNTVERTIRPIALNRKNALFAGRDAGVENWVVIASLIETCKINAADPHASLASTWP